MFMKTYVLMLSQVFPADHPRAGESTIFATKLQNAIGIPILGKPFFAPGEPATKVHTIRANYDLWKKRFDKIDKGESELSIRVWDGKPYRSKQIEIARLTKEDGIGLQKIEVSANYAGINNWQHFKIDDKGYMSINDMPNKDGLSREDWIDWFKNYDLSKPMAIIHFTPFRY